MPHTFCAEKEHRGLRTGPDDMADLHAWWMYPLLTLLGGVLGTYGSLIGAGGGIFLVPTLLLLYPQESPNTIASISLAVVFVNAASGTIAYARMRRVDYQAGLLFAAATVPGAIFGAYVTSLLSRQVFDSILSVLILSLAAFLILRPTPRAQPLRLLRYGVARRLTDAKGVAYDYTFNMPGGMAWSFFIGWLS